jgi:hypothetical protein
MRVALCSVSVGGVVASMHLVIIFSLICVMVASTVESMVLPNKIPRYLEFAVVVIPEVT